MLASAGDVEAALAVLDEAARADPTSKAPWMRKTQMHFQAEHYGAAVVSAQEVLARDPDDHVADSYLVVSSLRIAIGTLARMQGPDGLTGAARAEAERLAASMRQTLGEDILVPQAAQAPQPPAPRPACGPGATGRQRAGPTARFHTIRPVLGAAGRRVRTTTPAGG
ncbi:tetratricopeptide repeat protein [Alkalisalibacterium limincola]|uniref:Uncharacterized protein n=1 Tax=Alkalisalibacterium limincola TaxID=2699169 RepID=A0A5C8KSY7_9GAMM|nr:hypothetical protein [Alkalisalibacterium limincola]TXK62606.1 hypothetical protein FU658_07630 [Alkalisalibacterium limincola]